MRARRVYLPLSLETLRRLTTSGELGGGGELLAGYAVTAAVTRELGDADEEEREYDALLECADAASGLAAGSRRVVASADVEPGAVEEVPDGYAQVRVRGPVPALRVVSFHVDEDSEHRDEDLLWYDATELDEVLRLVAGD